MKCKKLTALMLTTAVTASLLAGCGGNSAGGTDNGGNTAGTNTADTSGGVIRGIPILPKTEIRRLPNFLILSRCRVKR